MMRKVECRPSAGPKSSSSKALLVQPELRAGLLVEGRRPRRHSRRARLGPGQHQVLARAGHGHVHETAHRGLVGFPVVRRRQGLLEELVGYAVGALPEGARHAPGGEAEHEHVVELEALGRLHVHELHRRGRRLPGDLLLRQARFGHRGEVAAEFARGRLRLAAHIGGGQLGQLGDVAQPLHGVGLGGEHLLSPQSDALDQAQDEGVRPAVLEGAGRGAVEPKEGAHPVAALLGELWALERGGRGRGHVQPAAASELGETRHVDRAQLDRWAAQRPHHGAGVARVGQSAQPGQHVAYLGALEVGGRAAGARRHRPLLQRGGQHGPLVLHRPHQHADLLRGDPAGDELFGFRGHGLGLRTLGTAAPEAHPSAAGPLERLGDAVGRGLHHGGRRPQDAPAAAFALLELDHRDVVELALEAEQVLRRGAPEAVDRLIVVARHGHVAVLLGEEAKQHPLGKVHVLVVVHEHVVKAARDALTHVRAPVQQGEGPHDQVAEVERAACGQQPIVVGVEPGELELPVGPRAGGVAGGRRSQPFGVAPVVLGRDHLVLQAIDPRHEAGQQGGRVAARLVVAQGQVVQALQQQGEAIGRADRREERVHAGLERLVAEQAQAERVEGAHAQLLVGRLQELLEPLQHLGRRRGREGEAEHRVGGRLLLDQPGEAADERRRLAGPGPAQDEKRAAGVRHGGLLRAVQAVEGF